MLVQILVHGATMSTTMLVTITCQSTCIAWSRFDAAFDFAGDETALSFVKPQGWFLTAVSPVLQSTDNHGLLLGGASAAAQYTEKAVQVIVQKLSTVYGRMCKDMLNWQF